jgi:hypothetical protein
VHHVRGVGVEMVEIVVVILFVGLVLWAAKYLLGEADKGG